MKNPFYYSTAEERETSLLSLIMSLSQAMDLVSPHVAKHQLKVAYLAAAMAKEMGFPDKDLREIQYAGILHDIGALSLSKRLEYLSFEINNPHRHAELGYLLLSDFSPLEKAASIIRHHHVKWNSGEGKVFEGIPVKTESHLVHLADRVSVLLDQNREVLSQVSRIKDTILDKTGTWFYPEAVKAFLSLAEREAFWITLALVGTENSFCEQTADSMLLDSESLLDIAKLFARVIDFRCRFTATHSSSVASVALFLARERGFSSKECRELQIAGYMHDLGKLSVPLEILNKPGPLSQEELYVIKKHPFYSFKLIEQIGGMERIKIFGSLHHEGLTGNGYPFHLSEPEIPLGSRIVACADIFTALTEDRPYRKGMEEGEVVSLLVEQVQQGTLDKRVVAILLDNKEKVFSIRAESQAKAEKEYSSLESRVSFNSL